MRKAYFYGHEERGEKRLIHRFSTKQERDNWAYADIHGNRAPLYIKHPLWGLVRRIQREGVTTFPVEVG
jgi:hypothetical protein